MKISVEPLKKELSKKEVSSLLKKIRNGIKFLKNKSDLTEKAGQKKVGEVINIIEEIMQTDQYKRPFVKSTLNVEFFWFVTDVSGFGSRDLAIRLCELQEKLAK